MRSTNRWASSRYQVCAVPDLDRTKLYLGGYRISKVVALQDDEVEDPLVEALKTLRRKVFSWHGGWALPLSPSDLALAAALCSLPREAQPWPIPGCADWSEVEPLEYLAPFLQVIKTPETSGTVTDVALSAVLKFLDNRLLGEHI